MKKMNAIATVFAAAVSSAAAWAGDVPALPSVLQQRLLFASNAQGSDNDIHALDLTPAQSADANAAAAEKRKSRPQSTRGSRAASVDKRRTDAAVDRYPDNDVHALDPSAAESAKARQAGRQARSEATPASRAASAQARKSSPEAERYPDNDVHSLDASASQSRTARTEAATAKQSRSARTSAEKRTVRSEKQKDLDVSEKSGPGS
jgi:hypothetical protein